MTTDSPAAGRTFLTGATGYIGSAVADRLRAAGRELSGLARSAEAAARLESAGIRPIRGDFTDRDSLRAAARAADGVISMATTYDPAVDGPAIDVILEALAGSGKPFVYTSGIWSHGDTAGAVVDEATPPKPAALVAWRQAVEDRVRAGAERGIRSVVIRPAVVYGRGGGIPAGFVESARKRGAARYVGSGTNRWPFVHVDDLADLYLLALGRKDCFMAAGGGEAEARFVRRRAGTRSAGVRPARRAGAGMAATPARRAGGDGARIVPA
jgi:nucleoside-diphosphate-sugar epimerase